MTEHAGEHRDLIDVLAGDHRTIEELLAELESAESAGPGSARSAELENAGSANPESVGWEPRRERDLVDVAVAELMRHAVAEEQYLYPAIRRYLDDGDELANRELAEHHEIERLMSDLMGTDVEHPEFGVLVARLIREVRRHVDAEESALFARLRAACEPDALVNLGTEALAAKKLAPTRPHPSVPMNRVAGPIVGLFDQTVDALTDRPTSLEEL